MRTEKLKLNQQISECKTKYKCQCNNILTYQIIMQSQQQDNQSQEDQLHRQFDKQQFINIVNSLLQQFNLKAGRGAGYVYDQIMSTKGKVVGKDILEAVESVKHDVESRKIIDTQIANYRYQITELKKKGISCISILQFQELFQKQNPNGLITDQIKKKVKNIDYISLQKLSEILDDIQQLEDGNVLKHKLQIGNLQKSSIFAESVFDELPDFKINDIIEYAKQNVLDTGVKVNLVGMLKQVQRKLYEVQQNQIVLKEVQQTLRRNQQQVDDELYRTYKLMDDKSAENDRLRSKIKQYQQEITIMNKRYQHDILNNLQALQSENQMLNKSIVNVTLQNQQLQTKIQWFKTNYEGITKQYQQFIREVSQSELKQNKQKQERMFVQRTAKEQLEDALAKISRLRTQNSELKQRNSDVVFDYENKISNLQERIKQIQQSRQAYHISRSFLGDSKIRNSYLDYKSRIDNNSENQTIKPSSRVVQKTQSNQTQDSQYVVRSSVEVFRSKIGDNQSAFKKKKQLISIRISALDIDDEDNHIDYEQDSVTDKKEESKDLSMSRTQRSISSKLPNSNQKNNNKQSQKDEIKNEQKKQKRLLASLGYIIISDGSRYPAYIILSQDRFTFLDSKLRPNYTIKLSQLKKIILCHHNTSWMVLKVKPGQFNQKKQQINDTVLSVMNRTDMLQFMHLRCSKKLQQNTIKIEFQKQDNIWVSGHQTQTLLSNFTNYYNLNRISINNAGNMFEASVKQNSVFNFADDVIIIVSKLGILVFQKDGDYLLQRNQKLLYIIPIVELMEIQTVPGNQNKLVIKYKTDKKTIYKLKLNSKSMAKKLKMLIQIQRRQTAQAKAAQVHKYSIFTSVLSRTSIQK